MFLVEHDLCGLRGSSNVFLLYGRSLLRPEMEVERTVKTDYEFEIMDLFLTLQFF